MPNRYGWAHEHRNTPKMHDRPITRHRFIERNPLNLGTNVIRLLVFILVTPPLFVWRRLPAKRRLDGLVIASVAWGLILGTIMLLL